MSAGTSRTESPGPDRRTRSSRGGRWPSRGGTKVRELSEHEHGTVASACPGCGLVLPVREGPTHAYLGASPACWALHGDVLAREYSDPDYSRVHQLTVDTYAVQHPGVPERRSTQSVAVHLMTLCLVLEDGLDPREGPKLHKRFVERPLFHWLEPPQPNGTLTVADVREATTAAEHERKVNDWARDVWAAWEPHHVTVRSWVERALR